MRGAVQVAGDEFNHAVFALQWWGVSVLVRVQGWLGAGLVPDCAGVPLCRRFRVVTVRNATQTVAEQVKIHDGGAGVLVNVELLHIHGGDAEDVAVRAVTSRRAAPRKPATPASLRCVRAPAGASAPVSMLVTLAGMLETVQCQKPLGTGRIRVEAGQYEGLGALGNAAPGQLRGAVLTARHAEEGGAHPFGGGAAVLNVGGGQGEFGQFGQARVGFAGQGCGADVGPWCSSALGCGWIWDAGGQSELSPARRRLFSRRVRRQVLRGWAG